MMKNRQNTMPNGGNPRIGSSVDEFLDEQGLLKECEHQALKEILADQVRRAMAERNISKTAMAERMKTSRRQLDRLLDPKVENVTLATMAKAARAVGRELRIDLV
jgi:antitoxin HicB